MEKLICTLLVVLGTSISVLGQKPYVDSKHAAREIVTNNPTKPIHTLYLLGDAGDTKAKARNPVLSHLSALLKQESKNSSVTFLGDQVYPAGLPTMHHEDRPRSELILKEQLESVEDFKGKTYFIAGERDWNNGDAEGRKAVERMEDFVEDYFDDDDKVKFYPGKGCGDPKVVKVEDDLVFLFINSQWWLQKWTGEKDINDGCDIKSRYDLLAVIREIFTEHKNDEVVVFTHHPIRSNGHRGGKSSFYDHIFPFAASHDVAVPLPVIGSFVPIFRNVTGSRQDLSNALYRDLMDGIDQIARSMGTHTIFAAAHDHNLQHFSDGKWQYIVSGSASHADFVGVGEDISFAYAKRGFAKISFYEEFETWMEFFALNDDDSLEQVYKTQLRPPRPGTVDEIVDYPPISTKDTVLAASVEFAANGLKETFLGDQYRSTWTTPVRARLIDLEKELGGLTPVKKGGGMASNSLRMERDDGRQYILRSIKKDYRKLVPPDFANLKLLDVLKDQNSASHPYGAMALPKLSKAANIYYTTPELVYLKHQRGLLNYNSQFPEELYLLEQRPDEDNWKDVEQFGKSDDIIGYVDVLANLRDKKTHFVDQSWVCRSRMFDLLIHDFDRHDDQWRWASFEEDDRTVYRPIPRDRDQAFYRFRGIIPWYIAAFVERKFKTMKDDIKDVRHQSFNARYFDRYFMNELSWPEWEKEIKYIQANVTDEVIDQAMQDLPSEVVDLTGPEIAKLLKARRSNLLAIGRRLYDFINKEVEITGTNDDDNFTISRNADGSVRVQYEVERNEKGDVPKYDRTFFPSETKEIRIYGLRGDDDFNLVGSKNNKIRIRIIGGEEDDEVTNASTSSKIYVYDSPDGIEIEGKVRDKTSDEIGINEYDRRGFRYNKSFPFAAIGYTVDDGVWIGGSYAWTNHAWRKDPYRSKQSIRATIAPGSRDAYQLAYSGHFPGKIVDFAPEVSVDFPRYENFFGIGNSTVNPLVDRRFHWVRIQSVNVSPLLRFTISDQDRSYFRIGPTFESHQVRTTEGRVSLDPVLGFDSKALEPRSYIGGTMDYFVGFVDSKVYPTNGFGVNANARLLAEVTSGETVSSFSADLRFYVKISNRPQLVFANMLGVRGAYSDVQFYQLADLGNRSNLRGFRNERFRGNTAFFHNIDLRCQLGRWRTGLLPLDVGLVGGFDYGRVWVSVQDDTNDRWHQSLTAGLTFDILGVMVLHPYYSFNTEQNQFSFRVGFYF